jgi:hypothetical protein
VSTLSIWPIFYYFIMHSCMFEAVPFGLDPIVFERVRMGGFTRSVKITLRVPLEAASVVYSVTALLVCLCTLGF